jgi:hypothetical protein
MTNMAVETGGAGCDEPAEQINVRDAEAAKSNCMHPRRIGRWRERIETFSWATELARHHTLLPIFRLRNCFLLCNRFLMTLLLLTLFSIIVLVFNIMAVPDFRHPRDVRIVHVLLEFVMCGAAAGGACWASGWPCTSWSPPC